MTGTLWSGSVARGDAVDPAARGRGARVRAVQVHDAPVERAAAGQRVAVNLGRRVREVARGDVLADPRRGSPDLRGRRRARPSRRGAEPAGSRCTTARGRSPARVAALGGRFCSFASSIRSSRRRRPARRPRGRSAGHARRRSRARSARPQHGRSPTRRPARAAGSRRAGARRAGAAPKPSPRRSPRPPLGRRALALEERLRAAGHEPPPAPSSTPAELPRCARAGRAVRVGRTLHYHPEALAG